MKKLPPAKLPALTESQIRALVQLLGDEDQQIFEVARNHLTANRMEVTTALKSAELSNEPLLRKRASALLDLFAREDADTEFLRFCLTQGEEFDLETGVFLLAKTTLAQTNILAYSALLDQFASEIRLQMRSANSGAENLAIINECLFDQLGFNGNEQNYYDPANSYLPEVIDRRSGNPISLCSIYMFIGKRLQLPIIGIGLPGHFVCRYQSTTEEYYIDAFNRGKLLTKNDCIKFLVKTNHTLQEGYLLPMSPRRILMRMCANLHQIYTELKYPQETERFQRYLVALAK